MNFDPGIVAIIAGIAVLTNRLVEALATPLFDKFEWDKFPLMYVAWVFSGVIVWLTGVNLFEVLIPNSLAGQIITAIIAGGGANLLHDFIDKE